MGVSSDIATDHQDLADEHTPDEVESGIARSRTTDVGTADRDDADKKPPDTPAEEPESDQESCADSGPRTKRSMNWSRVLAYGVVPGAAMLLAAAAGFFKWEAASVADNELASVESVAVAKDSTVALLSYQPDTVDKVLAAAQDRLTGDFKESYAKLTHDVVIPGAKQKHISAMATVPAVAAVSASPTHAVALVFVNQTVIVGSDVPTATASTVRVTLEKVHNRWLISKFDPV